MPGTRIRLELMRVVNSGNVTYRFRDRGNVYINNLPPMFDGSFGGSGGESNFEAINDDTKNMKSNDYRVTGCEVKVIRSFADDRGQRPLQTRLSKNLIVISCLNIFLLLL